jgi:hypothetical protein
MGERTAPATYPINSMREPLAAAISRIGEKFWEPAEHALLLQTNPETVYPLEGALGNVSGREIRASMAVARAFLILRAPAPGAPTLSNEERASLQRLFDATLEDNGIIRRLCGYAQVFCSRKWIILALRSLRNPRCSLTLAFQCAKEPSQLLVVLGIRRSEKRFQV